MVCGHISLTCITLTSGLSLKLHEFYEISISNSGPLKLNQKKYITIIKCLKTCAPEDYLQILPLNLAYTFVHFRTLNHRLPIQRGRVMNLPYEDRLCTKCSSADIGDEFHYAFTVLVVLFFAESRKKYLSPFYCKNANVNRFHSIFCSCNRVYCIHVSGNDL